MVKVIGMFKNTLSDLCIAKNGGVKLEDLCDISDLNLEKLNITGCSSISDAAFLTFIFKNPNLRKLEMENSRNIFSGLAEGADAIFGAMNHLNSINLSENSIPHFNKIRGLKLVKSLQMDSLDSPGSVILKAFQSLNTSSLESWRARFLSMQGTDLIDIFKTW